MGDYYRNSTGHSVFIEVAAVPEMDKEEKEEFLKIYRIKLSRERCNGGVHQRETVFCPLLFFPSSFAFSLRPLRLCVEKIPKKKVPLC